MIIRKQTSSRPRRVGKRTAVTEKSGEQQWHRRWGCCRNCSASYFSHARNNMSTILPGTAVPLCCKRPEGSVSPTRLTRLPVLPSTMAIIPGRGVALAKHSRRWILVTVRMLRRKKKCALGEGMTRKQVFFFSRTFWVGRRRSPVSFFL